MVAPTPCKAEYSCASRALRARWVARLPPPMWSRSRSPARARPATPIDSAMVNAKAPMAGKLERFFKVRSLEARPMNCQIVQVVQELSTAGGVETVAAELARVFTRSRLPNVVLASAVSKTFEQNANVERVAPWLSLIPTRGVFRHLGRILVVPLFTLAATRTIRKRYPNAVVLSHGDSLAGDALVVHAVNAQSLTEKRNAGSWGWLLNPMHLWVSLRDRWMIGGLRYRTFVAVSSRVATELQRIYAVPSSRIRVIYN